MASLKYFLLSPFLFLCLSYTFANGVFNYDDGLGFGSMSSPTPDPSAGPVDRGVSNFGIGPKAGPRAGLGVGGISNVDDGSDPGPKAGPGVKEEMSNVGAGPRVPKLGVSSIEAGPRAGPKGVDPIVTGLGVGVGVNLPPIFGGPKMGIRPGPGGWYGPGPIIQEPYNNCMLGYVCPTNRPWACGKVGYGLCESYNFRPLSASTELHDVKINWAKSKSVETAQHGESGPGIHIDSAH
ncbi:hypothetical protein Csa_011503 [Cucumis sativus]|uniref:Uncharacterized protein n=1 Tax=Cucumis sativus TaxID=3659 RepID=A0A0A0L7X7_CUCSA|nr:hypothetical protein Csa_011503 [Cucumis sativus]